MLDLNQLLDAVAPAGGSDLHLTVGAPPTVRVRGEMTPVPGTAVLTAEDLRETLYAVMMAFSRAPTGLNIVAMRSTAWVTMVWRIQSLMPSTTMPHSELRSLLMASHRPSKPPVTSAST